MARRKVTPYDRAVFFGMLLYLFTTLPLHQFTCYTFNMNPDHEHPDDETILLQMLGETSSTPLPDQHIAATPPVQEATTPQEAERESTRAILEAYQAFVRKDYADIPNELVGEPSAATAEYEGDPALEPSEMPDSERRIAIKEDFKALFAMLFGSEEKPKMAFTGPALREVVGNGGLNLKAGYDMLKSLQFPMTANIPLFKGCGGILIARRDGTMVAFDEVKTGGVVYDLIGDTSPYLLFKMAALETLEKLGYEPNLEENADVIASILGRKNGTVHMGGYLTELPIGPNGEMERVVMGLSSEEITDAALAEFMKWLTHPESIDPYPTEEDRATLPPSLQHIPYGNFTGAGFFDDIAGLAFEAGLKGKSYEACRNEVEARYNGLIGKEKQAPMPGRYC